MKSNKFFSLITFLIITIFVIFLNAFPNYFAFLKTPPGFSFSGQASWFDPWDINVYVSAIKWGQNQGLLLENIYTTSSNSPILFYPFYTILGSLFPNINHFLLFHLSTIVLSFLLLFTLWKMIKIFINLEKGGLIALLLISLGGGVGWLFFPSLSSSDLFMTGFTFTSHFQRPHEALGMIFYLFSLVSFYLAVNKQSFLLNLGSLFSLSLLLFFYPYYLLSFGLISGIYTIFLSFKIKRGYPLSYFFLNLIISLPIMWFYYQNLQSNPTLINVLSQKLSNQNITELSLGYGILLPLIFYQLKNPDKNNQFYFLNIWFLVSILLSFLPLGFARFYLRSLFFPLIILTLTNLSWICQKFKIPSHLTIIGLILIVPISSFYIAYQRIEETLTSNHWFYLTQNERNTLNFLEQKTPPQSGVLAAYTLGNIIPANTHNRVYFGHLIQTPKAQEKIIQLTKFYSNNFTEEEASKFLKEENISYIIFGEEERRITLSTNPSLKLKYTFLNPVFEESDITIFSLER